MLVQSLYSYVVYVVYYVGILLYPTVLNTVHYIVQISAQRCTLRSTNGVHRRSLRCICTLRYTNFVQLCTLRCICTLRSTIVVQRCTLCCICTLRSTNVVQRCTLRCTVYVHYVLQTLYNVVINGVHYVVYTDVARIFEAWTWDRTPYTTTATKFFLLIWRLVRDGNSDSGRWTKFFLIYYMSILWRN